MSDPVFPASICGSLPRSDVVRELISGEADLAADECERRMDAAIRDVVAKQEPRARARILYSPDR